MKLTAPCAVSLLLLSALHAGAVTKFEYWPGAVYDAATPTFHQVLGYDPGERLTSHAGIVKYLEALAAAAPARIKLVEYGRSWEGRRLLYAVIGSENHIRRLAEIRAGIQNLADPRRTPDPEARKLIASLPAVVWLAYGVHGNELSSPEAALLTAYHLLASRHDKMVDDILAHALIIVLPTQNPDGRDRFIHHFEQSEGPQPDANPMALEHTEPWPGGRGNHYSFDLNRDWIALTQPEIRSQVKALLEWFPLVYVDLHEMGADSTYYFAPEAVPFNPHLASDQVTSLLWFGKNNARWFDKFGFSYFTREVFDAFYPGYGASWPSYFGSVAMTYEQASSRGLLMRRADESVFHFRDTVRHHFVASLSTAETTARNREHLLGDFYQYRQSAIEEGRREPVREYLLPRSGDVSSVDHLALLLAEHGVEVRRAKSAFRAAAREFPASSYAISLAQPAKRLIRALLDADVRMEPPFLKEQERRRAKKLSDEIYDVTAWSLPLMFNLECVPSAEPVSGDFEMVRAGEALPGKVDNPNATVAYLVPWGTASAGRFLTAALRQDLRLWSADKAFVQSGRKFPSGTLIIKVKEHGADLAGQLARLALSSGAEVVGTETGWVDEGPDFGSNHVLLIRPPSIALAWDHPTSPLSAGATRFLLERRYQYPVTAVRSSLLSGADLRRFQVLILPDQGSASGYSGVFGAEGAARLKQWVTAGGTLVGFAGAVGFLADPKVALLDVAQENAWRSSEPPKKTEPPELRVPGKLLTSEADYLKSIQADKELPDQVPGVIARARLDRDHWIAAGMGSTVTALIDGRNIFTPIKLDKGVNAALFLGPDKLLASGYLWEENRKQLAYKPLVIVQRQGRGLVVAFTADPTFRAYLDGLDVLLLNAVFRGPAHTSRAPIE